MTVRWLSVAEQDFSEALGFYIEESPQAAERFCDEIDRSIELIQKKPTTFRVMRRQPCSEIGYFPAMRAEPLQPTRVHRFYRGGALLGGLRGEQR